MAFHEEMWIVAGTAAPVTAVAVVISLGELMKEISRWMVWGEHTEDPSDQELNRIPLVLQNQTGYMKQLERLGLINLLIQAGLLAVALVSLEDNADAVPPWLAIAGAIAGLLLLATCSLAGYRKRMQRVDAMARDDVEEKEARARRARRDDRQPTPAAEAERNRAE